MPPTWEIAQSKGTAEVSYNAPMRQRRYGAAVFHVSHSSSNCELATAVGGMKKVFLTKFHSIVDPKPTSRNSRNTDTDADTDDMGRTDGPTGGGGNGGSTTNGGDQSGTATTTKNGGAQRSKGGSLVTSAQVHPSWEYQWSRLVSQSTEYPEFPAPPILAVVLGMP
ncbi:hypothetical protein CERSUDRAFT_90693 [Gelatoporia subvermispora B]|uniref:Uncharacterized protein n=1 Tax=Ceriporiopsis subvermispora (strain B) TaxID=914234 RepID=M2RCB6_CERS8|nr:hypothetical protein CERSUDRAFT_90693 [Gelatoporia subvermispora B]